MMRRLATVLLAGVLVADGYVLLDRAGRDTTRWSTVLHAVSVDRGSEARLVAATDSAAWQVRLRRRGDHERVVWRSAGSPRPVDVRFDLIGNLEVVDATGTRHVVLV
jgi:hypothetical protein